MSFNFNRHNSVGGNWHLPPMYDQDVNPNHQQAPANSNYLNLMPDYQGQSFPPPQLRPGFKDPWFSQHIPNKGSHIHNQKRLSYANQQLPTTYEDGEPLIHPPTRADNPFNQYYTSQEVTLGPDRRMSAAVDTFRGSHGHVPNSNNAFRYQLAPPVSTRRSSLQVGDSHQPFFQRFGRSPSQYQQPFPRTQPRIPAPKAVKVVSKNDLHPKVHHQPKYRRCSVNSVHISPLNALLVYLTELYAICQPRKFQYSKTTNPRRVLTKPSEPKFNNGYDNEDSDYILYVNDMLGTEEGRKYMVLDLLGLGTFGQVVKCQNLSNQSVCAVKVIKSKPAYLNQSLTEKRILEFLNANSDGTHFIRLLDTFMHKEHLCLVFELLASNLYELIKQNQFQGLNIKLVKLFTKQLLEAMAQLKGFQMIHCDLKPENILLCHADKPDIKVIDFGSACFTKQTIYTYIQSRFYRLPEIILGLPYTESIDMWLVGCIVGELFLGLPMFPGTSEYNQIWKIVDMLGMPPRHMIEVGRNSLNFFKKTSEVGPKATYQIKTFEEYVIWLRENSGERAKDEQPNKEYFKHRLLRDIITNYDLPTKKVTTGMIEKERQERLLLVDFLEKVLNMNPLERLTPQEALKHAFVTS